MLWRGVDEAHRAPLMEMYIKWAAQRQMQARDLEFSNVRTRLITADGMPRQDSMVVDPPASQVQSAASSKSVHPVSSQTPSNTVCAGSDAQSAYSTPTGTPTVSRSGTWVMDVLAPQPSLRAVSNMMNTSSDTQSASTATLTASRSGTWTAAVPSQVTGVVSLGSSIAFEEMETCAAVPEVPMQGVNRTVSIVNTSCRVALAELHIGHTIFLQYSAVCHLDGDQQKWMSCVVS